MKRILLIFFIFITVLNAEDTAGSFVKEKKEIMALKNDLNNFYKQKEDEYQKRKKELDALLNKIKSEKEQVAKIYKQNQQILEDIKGQVATKTSKIYNSMKPKVAAAIFDNMILEGKIDDVFDIILKLKEKKVTQIMKSLSVENAAKITEKLKNFSVENSKG